MSNECEGGHVLVSISKCGSQLPTRKDEQFLSRTVSISRSTIKKVNKAFRYIFEPNK